MNTYVKITVVSATIGLALLAVGGQAKAQVKSSHNCLTQTPGAGEVFVYRDANFSGPCAALDLGFFPHGTNLGIGNDQMSSLKVGSAVRARLFLDDTYGRSFLILGPGNYGSMPFGWNDQVSSARIESASRSNICNDLQPDEFALFWDANFGRDCVVLNVNTAFWNTPDDMGIMNDSISSIVVARPASPGSVLVQLQRDAFQGGPWLDVAQSTSITDLGAYNFNDSVSSIQIISQQP